MVNKNSINARALKLTTDTPVTLIKPNGDTTNTQGIFGYALVDYEADAPSGVVFQKRQAVLTLSTADCEEADQSWQVKINNHLFFVAQGYPDGQGITELWLANPPENNPNDKWC
ncbi:head-tail joining protein [Spartinivicinus poritis]|uniref:Uncharacterized protein n=1 Tax=Spartinivicinus poritis TaxID=2994640 RepID=A0ABT5UEI4_9GAMM|nr:hypothetical protein [Spartinivicinus sp. A2-2]MDE1464793.1 hypothetical protein [Spartinivicinus sp. A2-2]